MPIAEKRAERQQEMEKYVRDPEETETDTDDEESDCPALDLFWTLEAWVPW